MVEHRFDTIDQIFQDGVDRICAITLWSVGHVYVPRQESRSELIPTTLWYMDNREKFDMLRQVTKDLRFAKGIDLPGQVYATGEPDWVPHIQNDSTFTRGRLALDLGLQAAFAFPVKSQKQVIAVLEFFSENAQEPETSLIESIKQITSELGSLVEQKRREITISFPAGETRS